MSDTKSSNIKKTSNNVIFFKSPIWEHFKLCEDRKIAECQKCGEQITRCGQSAKRPRLDNLRKHLFNVHGIDIPTEETKNPNKSKLKKLPKKLNFTKNKASPSKKSRAASPPVTEKEAEAEPSNEDSLLDPVMCIKWNTYLSNMTSALPNLLHTEQFVDVTLACEGQSLKCHKILLASCSPYFYELLTSSVCTHPIIMFKDFHFWELQALVSFMYSGEVNVRHSQLPRLLRVADALQIKGLAKPVTKEASQPEVENQPAIVQEESKETVPKRKREDSAKPNSIKKKTKMSTLKTSKVQRKTLSPKGKSTVKTPSSYLAKRRMANLKSNASTPKRVSPRKALARKERAEVKDESLDDSHDLPEFLNTDMPDMLNDILAMKDVTEGISLPEAHRVGSVDGVFPLEDLETVKMDMDDVESGLGRMVANGLHHLDQFDYFPHINAELAAAEDGKR